MSDGEFCLIMIFLVFVYSLPYLIIFLPSYGNNVFEEEDPEGTARIFCAYSCCYEFIPIEYDELPARFTCPHSHCSKEFILFRNIGKVDSATDIQYDVYKTKQRYIATLEQIVLEDIPIEARKLITDLTIMEIEASDDPDYATLTFSSIDRKTKIIERLAKVGNHYIVPALFFLLKDRINWREALQAIGQIGGEEAEEILKKIASLPSGKWFDHGIYNSAENLHVEMEDYGESYYPYGIKEEALEIMSRMKLPSTVEPMVKAVILEYDSYNQEEQIEMLMNFKSEANTKLSEYLLDRQKLESEVFHKSLTDEEYFKVEYHILKAVGATGGSDNPAIRKLTIRGIISSYIIDRDDIQIVADFKTEEELVEALDQDEYVLQSYNNEDDYGHIYWRFPKDKHSNEEIKMIVRASIVEALGMLWHRKASNSIIKLMENIELQEVDSEYKLRLIRECVKTLGKFKLKKALKPIKEIKKFCEKDHDNFSLTYEVLEEIHNTLALLGERNSVIHIVRKFKSDENDSEVKKIIEDIDAEILGEVFASLELFDDAERLYTKNGMLEKSAEMRKKKAMMSGTKTVVEGDYVDDRDTIVKDSVISRSNIGASEDKFTRLEKLAAMKKEGLIDDDEFKQMKKEILGK